MGGFRSGKYKEKGLGEEGGSVGIPRGGSRGALRAFQLDVLQSEWGKDILGRVLLPCVNVSLCPLRLFHLSETNSSSALGPWPTEPKTPWQPVLEEPAHIQRSAGGAFVCSLSLCRLDGPAETCWSSSPHLWRGGQLLSSSRENETEV